MGPQERIFKPEYTQQLLRLSREDLKTAELLSKTSARPENTLYHVQQSVEKSLKAVLCFQRKPVPMTHDIEAILNLFDKKLPPFGFALGDLTPYATIRRYEEGTAIIPPAEIEAGIVAAQQVLDWARKACGGDKA